MSKFHVNPAGEPGVCTATRQCPFGGEENHFDTPEAARSSYEEKMNVDGYMFKPLKFSAPDFSKATPEEIAESRDKAANAYENSFPSRGNAVSTADKAIIQKVLDGKKVPDEKIDQLLDSNFALEMPGGNRYHTVEDMKPVFDHLRLVRAQSQTPSTLTRLDAFDPSSQSMYSADARKDPAKMAKAMQKTLNNVDHYRNLADENYWSVENDPDLDEKEKAYYAGQAEILLEQSKREEVRADAMLKEMKWKLDNDPQFASRADAKAVAAAKRFKLRENPGKYSVGKVRKVTGE